MLTVTEEPLAVLIPQTGDCRVENGTAVASLFVLPGNERETDRRSFHQPLRCE